MRHFVTLVVLVSAALACAQAPSAKATCKPTGKCNACSNCHYCKHCSKQGGSCSVCRREKEKMGDLVFFAKAEPVAVVAKGDDCCPPKK